jgi:hypothetical protein
VLAPGAAARLAGGAAGTPPGAAAVLALGLGTWHPGFAAPRADGNLVDRGTLHARDIKGVLSDVKSTLATLQTTAGPVFADGPYGPWELGFASFLAGYVDGATGELATGSPDGRGAGRGIVVPDFALGAGRGVVRFGMGDIDRFFAPEDPAGFYPLGQAQLDELRATEISYGFGPAWSARPGADGDPLRPADQAVEYFLMKPAFTRIRSAGVREVTYERADGTQANLAEALRTDLDLARPRIGIHLNGGGVIRVNHTDETWRVLVDGTSYFLPTHGWLVHDPGAGLFALSAEVGGNRVDYLRGPDWTLLDGRGQEVTLGGLTTVNLLVEFLDGARIVEEPGGELVLE